jgi:membrane-associated phospholipid phosphatase
VKSAHTGPRALDGAPALARSATPALRRLTGRSSPEQVRRPGDSPLRRVLPAPASERIAAFDRAVDTAVGQHLRGRPAVDRFFYTASALGDFSLLWHLVGTARALGPVHHEHQALRLALSLGLESVLINAGLKSLFQRTRPPREEHHLHHLRQPRSSSFPSGHATSGFMAATLLGEGAGSLRVVWYGMATVVAASRVHVGIHHASDVVVGALIGTALGRLVLRTWPLPPAQPASAPRASAPGATREGPVRLRALSVAQRPS